MQLSLSELSKRAVDAGATQDAIEEAHNTERPKEAMIALIVSATVPDGEELNLALQAEVLYFTLLGLRAAAAGEHLWWKNNSRGDAGVDLVSAIRSGKSTAAVNRDRQLFTTSWQSVVHEIAAVAGRPQYYAAW